VKLLKLLRLWPPFSKANQKLFPGSKSVSAVGAVGAVSTNAGFSGKTVVTPGVCKSEVSKP